MDIQSMMQDESAELQMWQQVLQLAQSGSQDALEQIVQIAQQAIQAQEEEMKEIQSQGQDGTAPAQNPGKASLVDKLKAAMMQKRQQQAGGQAPQAPEGQEGGE